MLDLIGQVIVDVETATKPSDIHDLKKLSGAEGHYRIRVGSFRVGVVIQGEEVTFVRCLPRKDLYKFFP